MRVKSPTTLVLSFCRDYSLVALSARQLKKRSIMVRDTFSIIRCPTRASRPPAWPVRRPRSPW